MDLHLLLWGGIIAGPLFIIIFLVEGFVRPNYNSLRQPVSALSQGSRGWVQQFNFFSSGVLLLACAAGLYIKLSPMGSVWGWILILLYALGLLGAGIFVTDNGLTTQNSKRTRAGVLHDLCSIVVFVSLCIACFVFAHTFTTRGSPAWAVGSTIVGILYGVGFVIFARAFSPTSSLAPIGGLLQRLTISLGAVWVSLLALYFL